MLVAMLVISPTTDYAFASSSKTKKSASETTKTSKSKDSIEKRNLKTEARHNKLQPRD
jgi:hypothetical protein